MYLWVSVDLALLRDAYYAANFNAKCINMSARNTSLLNYLNMCHVFSTPHCPKPPVREDPKDHQLIHTILPRSISTMPQSLNLITRRTRSLLILPQTHQQLPKLPLLTPTRPPLTPFPLKSTNLAMRSQLVPPADVSSLPSKNSSASRLVGAIVFSFFKFSSRRTHRCFVVLL